MVTKYECKKEVVHYIGNKAVKGGYENVIYPALTLRPGATGWGEPKIQIDCEDYCFSPADVLQIIHELQEWIDSISEKKEAVPV